MAHAENRGAGGVTRALRAVRREGLRPLAGRALAALTGGRARPRTPEAAFIEELRLFDAGHYLDANPDVAQAGVDPLGHYLRLGWREERSPHPMFDPAYYREANPEVAAQGLAALTHFAATGMREGRRPSRWFDEDLALPLPESAWAAGASRVERVIRTFVTGREAPLGEAAARELAREIAHRAGGNAALAGPDGQPAASVIVPAFNQLKFTLWCLHALVSAPYRRPFEIVVVDDGSSDATPAVLPGLPRVRYARQDANQGFVHACNRGAREARGETLVFLNNDTLPLPGWLDALIDTLRARADAALVGAKLLYPDGRLQEAAGIVWQDGAVWNYGRGGDPRLPEVNYLRPVDFCSGAAIAVRREAFQDAGGFDTAFAPAYAEDLDLGLRLRQRGAEVLYQPLSEVVHLEGVTAGTSTRHGVKAHQVRNLRLLFERWQVPLRAHRPEGEDVRLEKDRGVERRALFVDAFTPRPDQDAGSLDALHWMQSLTALGVQVTFLPWRDLRPAGRYTSDLQRQGVECVSSPAFESAEQFLAAHGPEYDLLVFYRYEVADALMPAAMRHAPQAKRLLALCDLAHVRTQRQAELTGSEKHARAAREIRLSELLACARSDLVWTPSLWEKRQVQAELPHADVRSWPLAQDLRPPMRPWGERKAIGFLGGYRHAPNADAVLFFVRDVLPHVLAEEPGIVFEVAGSHATPEIASIAHPAVRVVGHVEDLGAFFEGLRVFVAPMRFGAGMKGKVAASLAAGVPVVGTSLALEGMGLRPEEGALAADDPVELAREVVRVYRGEELWTRLSRAGFAHAERDYSAAAATRHVAEAVAALRAPTRRSAALLGVAEPSGPFAIPGMQVDVCRDRAAYLALRGSDEFRRRVAFEDGLLRDAEGDEVVYRATSLPAGRPVAYRARVVDRAGTLWSGWREELACPYTGLNNRQRALATFARHLLLDDRKRVNDVYLTEQVTPLFKWIFGRFRTVRVAGSEYLGPDVAPGAVRDGIQHQDIERLSLASASVDLVVSGDVLEHVDEPREALAELARVLRPGGHLLFTVPFSWDRDTNRRRARGVGGSVEHLVEPCYHGNPMDPNGSLAYFDFGWELLDWVRAAGFGDVSLICYWSDTLGHLGGLLEVFHAVR